ncbi:UNVERIFIED_CONTAM: ThiF family adenylyltransferase, partial [Bacteroidetes bacterium 56_B9]
IGKIGIVDNDVVDISNLHRQVLHTTDTVGMLKCESAKLYLNRLNPHVDVVTHPERLTNENAFGIIDQYDLILDCTDTPATRYLINDVSVL